MCENCETNAKKVIYSFTAVAAVADKNVVYHNDRGLLRITTIPFPYSLTTIVLCPLGSIATLGDVFCGRNAATPKPPQK